MQIRKAAIILGACLGLVLPRLADASPVSHSWQALPATPALPAPVRSGHAVVRGVSLYYAQFGAGRPVVLLHGGLGNSEYWGHLVPALVAAHFSVTVIDSRGHGRSSRSVEPFGYGGMADDVLAVLDQLGLQQVDLVGWSDGGIIGHDISMRHPERLRRMVLYGANSDPGGVYPDVEKKPVFAAYIERAARDYERLSPTPREFDSFVAQIQVMWAAEPRYTRAQLARISTPTLVCDGLHEEAIRGSHTRYLARTIPGAKLLLLPGASHFGMLQTPAAFNHAVLGFLDVP